jgi:hypothetical protein
MIPPVNSLVKYDNPILVASTKGKKGDQKAAAPKAPPAATQTEDILNSILPPRWVFRWQMPLESLTLPICMLIFCIHYSENGPKMASYGFNMFPALQQPDWMS